MDDLMDNLTDDLPDNLLEDLPDDLPVDLPDGWGSVCTSFVQHLRCILAAFAEYSRSLCGVFTQPSRSRVLQITKGCRVIQYYHDFIIISLE